MKINDELLFFMIKSRLFAHLAFFPPSVCERRAPLFFSLSDQAGCALTLPDPPSSRPAPFCCSLQLSPPGFGDQLQQSFKLL